MSVQGKHRLQIWSTHQHPLKHTLNDFSYTNNALPGVNNLQQTIDWMVAVFYPNTKPAVATVAALPVAGNTLNDYRVVLDDGDGKAASYRWEQREGEAAPSWNKVYDMDWGQDSVLAAFMDITQELFVYKKGKMDTDPSGALLTGFDAGQHIYGGTDPGSNLTLHANGGDGLGPQTGFVQVDDNVRPTQDNIYSLGTLTERFLNLYLSGLLNVGNITIQNDEITSDTGVISFDDEDLLTTGDATVTQLNALQAQIGDLNFGLVNPNEITSDTGVIGMPLQTLTDLVKVLSEQLIIKVAGVEELVITSSALGASYDSLYSIHDFNNQAIQNVSSLSATSIAAITGTLGNFDFLADAISNANPVTLGFPLTTFSGDTIAQNASAGTVTGTISGEFGNYEFDATKATTVAANTDYIISPNGTGKVVAEKDVKPVADNSLSLGELTSRWKDLFLSGGISDGTNTVASQTLTSFRNANLGALNGQALFWDSLTSTWLPSYADGEVDHTTISNLTLGDAGHTQFAMLAGRVGGQVLQGGTAASENLELESTSNATKGNVIFKDTIIPKVTDTLDIGSLTNKIKDLYASGQNIGLREENTTTNNNFSLASVGRQYFNTVVNQSYRDAGDHAKYPLYADEYTETAAGAAQTLPFDIRMVANLTGALTSIANISVNTGIKGNRFKVLVNKTGAALVITNSANIFTGTGADMSLENNAAAILVYNGTAWQVIGGGGSGSSTLVTDVTVNSVLVHAPSPTKDKQILTITGNPTFLNNNNLQIDATALTYVNGSEIRVYNKGTVPVSLSLGFQFSNAASLDLDVGEWVTFTWIESILKWIGGKDYV